MQAYIAISFAKRNLLQEELEAITSVLQQHAIAAFVFASQYSFQTHQEKEMMQQAFAELDKCDLLIAEVSDKAIGIGIEAGYAKAKNKPVIYMRKQMAEHSTTMAGTSSFSVFYSDSIDLKMQLNEILNLVVSRLT